MPKGYGPDTITPTQEMIDDIVSSDLSIRLLGIKHGLGFTHVRNILKRAGILKTTKSGPPVKIKEPKPKKEKLPKIPVVLKPKELPIKMIKKEAKLTANTKWELEKERLDNAKSAQEKYKEMEAKKKEEGYKFVTRIGRLGIKETVLVKSN